MNIVFTKLFLKHYDKRIAGNPALIKKFSVRLKLFRDNPNHPSLRLHALKGNRKEFLAYSVTGDIRVVLYLRGDTAYFVTIGTHSQVY